MTAPAVVRRWNDPPPVRADRRAPDTSADRRAPDARASAEVGRQTFAVMRARLLRESLVRLRRVAPLGAVLLTGLVAHAGLAPHLAVRGAAPDVLLVAVVAMAVRGGARTGAGFGFATGLGADLFLATPLGTSALAYTLVGHTLGRSSRPRSTGSAAALCRPDSTCFSCRIGRAHPAEPATEPAVRPSRVQEAELAFEPRARPSRVQEAEAAILGGARPSRVRRRAAARRAALRRTLILTALGVAAGRLGTSVAATALGGLPFPGAPGLLHIAGVTALSAPLGPLAASAVRRLAAASEGRR